VTKQSSEQVKQSAGCDVFVVAEEFDQSLWKVTADCRWKKRLSTNVGRIIRTW